MQLANKPLSSARAATVSVMPYLPTIDALRGIASVLVCWFHIVVNGLYDVGPVLALSGSYGHVGVPIFFVISGFVIPYSLYRGRYTRSNFGRFVAKRIIRLDPPYLVTICLAILVPYVLSRSGLHRGAALYHPNWIQVVAHLGYANAFIGFPWLVGGFWSLAIEFQYYITLALVFPALLVRKPSAVAGLYLGAGALALIFPQTYLLPLYLPLFLIGISGFRYYVLGVSRWELVLCLAYASLLTAYTEQTLYAAAGLATCLCILFVTVANRPLRFLGSISYSLYLSHQIFFSIPMAQGVRFLGNHAVVRYSLPFVTLAFCIAVAWCLYKAVELPAQKFSSRFRYGAAKARATAA